MCTNCSASLANVRYYMVMFYTHLLGEQVENTRTPRMWTGFDFGLEPVRGAENVGSRIYSERIFPRFSPLTKTSLICDLVDF